MNYAIVYLPLNPEVAKQQNLPLKLPVLAEDLPIIQEENNIPLEIILRGLRAQWKAKKDAYYASYLRYFVFEKFKKELKDNHIDEAVKLLNESLLYGKEDYLYHFYNGLLFKKFGEYGEAENELRVAAAQNLSSPLLTFEIGQLLMEMDDIDGALEEFTETLERDARFVPAYVACGDIFHRISDYSNAVTFYKKAIELAPNFIPPYIRIGVLYNKKQNFDMARVYFEKGLKKEKENFELNYNIAFTYTRLKRPMKAIEHLKNCVRIDRKAVSAYNELGILYKNFGFFEESVKQYEAALKYADDKDVKEKGMADMSPVILKWHLAQSLALNGELDKAMQMLEAIKSADSSLPVEEYQDIIRHEKQSEVGIFSLSNFSLWVLDTFEEIDEDLKERFEMCSKGQNPKTDFSGQLNLELIPLVIEMVRAYRAYDITLSRALTLFASKICNSADWIVLSRIIGILSEEMGTETFSFDTIKDRLVDELTDLDWTLAREMVEIDRNIFRDVEELGSEQLKFNSLKDLLITILNVLWIEPTEAELNILLEINEQNEGNIEEREAVKELCLFLLTEN
ncbi:MAG TPA: tetratricopeptide repeat protein [Thermotogota bacterium]|nr:tetratricopeptide repeat protein [Thermotogota bacterium]